MPIKSFRGLITHLGSETISLHTNTGSTGYRIVKFECMPNAPGTANIESVTKIFTIPQGTPDALVDFSNQTLLGVNYTRDGTTTERPSTESIIFDNQKFNQDIYLTHSDVGSSASINYYIELETVNLALDENTVATLKDIRNITQANE
jgi:hypothetical protein